MVTTLAKHAVQWTLFWFLHWENFQFAGYIERTMRKLFEISDEEETRLWYCYSSTELDELTKEDSTVQDVGLCEDQLLVIETRSEDGSWNHPPKKYDSWKSECLNILSGVILSFFLGGGGGHWCFLVLNCSNEFMTSYTNNFGFKSLS